MERGEEFNNRIKESEGVEQDMSMPDIVIGHERGPVILSLVNEALKPDKTIHSKHPFARQVRDAFLKQPIPQAFKQEMESFFEDYDSETLLRLSFAAYHPERMDEVRRGLLHDKPGLEGKKEGFEWFVNLLVQFSEGYAELENKAGHYAWDDEKARQDTLPEVKRRLSEAKEFFNPAKGSAAVEKVILLPTDPLESPQSGVNVEIGATTFISSHRDNIGNQTHEFLHSIVNPMVERISMIEEQHKRIVDQASWRLKNEQEYGDDYFSLLCETLIRSYVDYWSKGEPLPTEQDFGRQIAAISPEQFAKGQQDSRERSRLSSLGIGSLEEFKRDGWKEYHRRYVSDPLGERVQHLYAKYSEQRAQTPSLRFEKFLREHIRGLVGEK